MVSKSRFVLIFVTALTLFMARGTAHAFTSFSISGYPTSNVLGLAVDPLIGSIFFTSLSYGGEKNLFEFNAAGSFVRSTRVPFDSGLSGHLSGLVVGGNGNLFIGATHGKFFPNGTWLYTHSIIEVSRNGSSVYSTIPNVEAYTGLSIDRTSGNLLNLDTANGRLVEMTPGGAVVRSQPFDIARTHIIDMAYDADGQRLFLSDWHGGATFLHEYQLDDLGQFALLQSYNLATIPDLQGTSAIAFNELTGNFYAEVGNSRIVIFGLNELQVVPEPSVFALLGFGSLILLRAKRRAKA